jgi:hypothetical protein
MSFLSLFSSSRTENWVRLLPRVLSSFSTQTTILHTWLSSCWAPFGLKIPSLLYHASSQHLLTSYRKTKSCKCMCRPAGPTSKPQPYSRVLKYNKINVWFSILQTHLAPLDVVVSCFQKSQLQGIMPCVLQSCLEAAYNSRSWILDFLTIIQHLSNLLAFKKERGRPHMCENRDATNAWSEIAVLFYAHWARRESDEGDVYIEHGACVRFEKVDARR